ncbi:uncharacterized protein EHS24_001384 [Apiotrichum porosum]|uniref:Uncharacterized protein n=1 Tax=Apiotrichum porosum TaxID=105984 RepID=A0A427XKM9_9TREE|nr:uncharacterized protein EHS24_001384 [Apiotrichum porosum]RSH79342.1 hypothetical protein EHS24_001384 [Apiotrichum porosum]
MSQQSTSAEDEDENGCEPELTQLSSNKHEPRFHFRAIRNPASVVPTPVVATPIL